MKKTHFDGQILKIEFDLEQKLGVTTYKAIANIDASIFENTYKSEVRTAVQMFEKHHELIYFFDDNKSNCIETQQQLGNNATVYYIQNVIKQ